MEAFQLLAVDHVVLSGVFGIDFGSFFRVFPGVDEVLEDELKFDVAGEGVFQQYFLAGIKFVDSDTEDVIQCVGQSIVIGFPSPLSVPDNVVFRGTVTETSFNTDGVGEHGAAFRRLNHAGGVTGNDFIHISGGVDIGRFQIYIFRGGDTENDIGSFTVADGRLQLDGPVTFHLRLSNDLLVFLNIFGMAENGVGVLYTPAAVVLGLVHAYFPYMVVTIYMALEKLDDSLLEASRSLGASKITTFFKVVFPLSMPGVISGITIVFVPCLGSFLEPRILGGTDGTVIGTVIEDQFFELYGWNFGAAIAFLLLAMVIISMAGLNKLGKRWETHE